MAQIQRCSKPRLIEIMNWQMHPIQFCLIVNLIRIQLEKVIDDDKCDAPSILTLLGIAIGVMSFLRA
jgi:hypothetical protein